LLWHTVKQEPLAVAVVEKGQLESTDNRDVICKVKAGSKGTFASTIKWVIDDGSIVNQGQLLIELDDSALQENYKTQSIVVEKAKAEWVKADEEHIITVKQNEADIAKALSDLKVAELDYDKFLGYRAEASLNSLGALVGGFGTLAEKGDYRSQLDDVSGRLKQAESDLDAYRDRAAWAERSVKLGYLTPTQARVEQTKMSGGQDTVEKLRKEKYILETFTRQRTLTDLLAKVDVARIGYEKSLFAAKSKEVQADSDRKTKLSVWQREVDRLEEIDEQIKACKLFAPQSGMVVYAKPESSRYSQTSQGLVAQGEQVKEGQKLMRIPDLRRMQVNTKVHEALVARIHGDDRRSTGTFDSMRAAMLLNPNPFSRLIGHSEHSLTAVREAVRDREYYTAEKGQRATVRVDAFPDRVFSGRVRSVAAVASSLDWGSDVKTYQTLVVIEETVEGLRPDMNAEVTIHIDDAVEPVLAVPIQAVVGGSEHGPKRIVYVKSITGPIEREVVLGKFNDKMIEVREGLKAGDEVLTNPKVYLGDKVKTREAGADAPKGREGMPGGGEKKKGGGDKKGGATKKGPAL
jgi:multidrug efflux pump subunit AcrA (membrane-fusion protein)